MKRTYDERYLRRSPRAVLSRAGSFSMKRRHVILGIILVAVLALFVLSCVLTASEANAGKAVEQSTEEVAGAAGPAPEPPGVYANAAVLIDADTGRVLYEKNAHETLPVASTTKIVTALVVREKLDLDGMITISPEAAAVGEQAINLVPGEQLSTEQLLYALLVQSANDAAYALAQSAAGSTAAFTKLMNQKAKELGAVESNFTNPHGLDEKGHYSTAYDLAVMGRELMRDPVLAEMVKTRRYDIPYPGQTWARSCINHNEILDDYPDATGIKTGYTGAAGRCLVASASRGSESLVATVLNSQYRSRDASALFDYGFAKLEPVTLLKAGEPVGETMVSAYPRRTVEAVSPGDVQAVSIRGAGDVFELHTAILNKAAGSVEKGDVLGRVEYSLNGKSSGRTKVVAAATTQKAGIFQSAAVFLWYSLCLMGRILSAPFRIF